MRRAVGVLILVALVAGGYALVHGGASASGYRVGAIFDTARGISKGSVVKIAGATVGEVHAVHLTANDQALVVMEVDRAFRPFRADASCAVRPEGLIGVRSIDCDPGTAVAAPLPRTLRHLPVVALARTQVPVDITDFFSIWKAPVRDRLRLLLNELGAGLAGRGEDLNAVLLRAAPALRKARRVLAVVDRQRDALRTLVTASNQVIGEFARHRGGLQQTIRAAALTFGDTAAQAGALDASIRHLPRTLARTRSATRTLSAFSDAAIPVLRSLQRAAPASERLLAAAPGFAADARPALRALSPSLATTTRVLRDARPFAGRLDRFTVIADPTGRLLNRLLISARDAGAVEGLLDLGYVGAALGSRFDGLGHLFPSGPAVTECNYDSAPAKGCDARYDKTYAAARRRHAHAHRHHARHRRPAPARPAPAAPATTPHPSLLNRLPHLPPLKLKLPLHTLDPLLNYLLG